MLVFVYSQELVEYVASALKIAIMKILLVPWKLLLWKFDYDVNDWFSLARIFSIHFMWVKFYVLLNDARSYYFAIMQATLMMQCIW